MLGGTTKCLFDLNIVHNRETCLSLHHPPQVEGDAPDDVDLCHGVSAVLIPLSSEAVLLGVT